MSQATVTRLQPRPARLTAVQRRLEAYGEVVELIAGEMLDPTIVHFCVGFILTGRLELSWRDGNNEKAFYPIETGDWFSVNNLSLPQPPRLVWFRATCFTRVLAIEVERLNALLLGELADLDGPLHREVMRFYAERWSELAARYHRSLFNPTDTLVLDALDEAASWSSAMSHPEGTLVKVGRDDLAKRIGCTRVTVSRALSRLVADGRVRLEGRRILLLGHQGRGEAA
ncbi:MULTISPECIES: Crp/Fnr family transcriptional regulator [Thiorhodovibrio]|uniref:Crp/Fnr family transcriptional regulator n=1 Tax=Thiorhodovibrio TaxID=61593 RepID=UPI001F5C1AA2|nr:MULTISPECIES: helix-turn-helix domain-containing protein [Thiorhodovibrio]WPL12424.1 Catabolite activation-like protein [Thiorhodovibrio litoralis]